MEHKTKYIFFSHIRKAIGVQYVFTVPKKSTGGSCQYICVPHMKESHTGSGTTWRWVNDRWTTFLKLWDRQRRTEKDTRYKKILHQSQPLVSRLLVCIEHYHNDFCQNYYLSVCVLCIPFLDFAPIFSLDGQAIWVLVSSMTLNTKTTGISECKCNLIQVWIQKHISLQH